MRRRPRRPSSPIVAIESLGYDAADEAGRDRITGASRGVHFDASYRTYDRLAERRGRPCAGADSRPTETVTVEIGVLCYTGRAALERAVRCGSSSRPNCPGDGGLDSIKPLLQELLDLVPLALAES